MTYLVVLFISPAELHPLDLQCMCGITVRESIRANFDFELPPPRDVSASKHRSHKPRFFRPQRGRYPLDILPTAQGLMIVGAFGQNALDMDSSNEEEDVDDDSFAVLDRQLQQHALELRRNNARSLPARGLLDPQDVDSDLSDVDEEMSLDPVKEMSGGGRNHGEASSSSKFSDNVNANIFQHSEDGVIADDEEEPDDEKEMHETSPSFPAKQDQSDTGIPDLSFYDPPEMVAGPSSSGLGKRSISFSSEEEQPIAASHTMSQAVEMSKQQLSALSQPQPIKSLYSTSSDTSGFGSLGDDMLPPSLPHSYSAELENISDSELSDLEVSDGESGSSKDKFTCASDFLKDKRSSKTSNENSVENDTYDNDGDDDDDDDDEMTREDSSDAGYMDAEDEGEDSDTNCDDDDDNKKDDTANAAEYVPRGPNFSVFLKEKVNTLPIPNSIKAFILHYR